MWTTLSKPHRQPRYWSVSLITKYPVQMILTRGQLKDHPIQAQRCSETRYPSSVPVSRVLRNPIPSIKIGIPTRHGPIITTRPPPLTLSRHLSSTPAGRGRRGRGRVGSSQVGHRVRQGHQVISWWWRRRQRRRRRRERGRRGRSQVGSSLREGRRLSVSPFVRPSTRPHIFAEKRFIGGYVIYTGKRKNYRHLSGDALYLVFSSRNYAELCQHNDMLYTIYVNLCSPRDCFFCSFIVCLRELSITSFNSILRQFMLVNYYGSPVYAMLVSFIYSEANLFHLFLR